VKVAVIGSGIAGNTLAWRLDRHHKVTVFEAGDYLGGHTHTHEVGIEGQQIKVDSGFIVFNDKTYPHFIAMLSELGIAKQKTTMSFSVHCERTGLEYAGSNLNTLFAQRRNLFSRQFYRLLGDILRFNREAVSLLDLEDRTITLGEYLRDERYSEVFQRHYILPMGAAIWSQDVEQMLDFPAAFFIRFFSNHGLLSINNRPQWYVVDGGSGRYVDRIYRTFSGQVRLKTPVQEVVRHDDRVELISRRGREAFDAVFFACHADQALSLLQQPTSAERETLKALPYQGNNVILHRGSSLLPDCRRAWSSWNYRLPDRASNTATVTYHMNRLQSLPVSTDICVTLNGDSRVPSSEILAEMSYQHPIFTLDGLKAQLNHTRLNGQQRSFYCGAYWRNGFHEDGVVSALTAIDDFNQWCRNHENQSLRRAG
jgi:uncharacterized protein